MRQIKRKISTFLKSEKASVSRKGLLTAAVSAGLVFVLSQNAAGHSGCQWSNITTHTNIVATPWKTATFNTQHYNHSNHAQHCSY